MTILDCIENNRFNFKDFDELLWMEEDTDE